MTHSPQRGKATTQSSSFSSSSSDSPFVLEDDGEKATRQERTFRDGVASQIPYPYFQPSSTPLPRAVDFPLSSEQRFPLSSAHDYCAVAVGR